MRWLPAIMVLSLAACTEETLVPERAEEEAIAPAFASGYELKGRIAYTFIDENLDRNFRLETVTRSAAQDHYGRRHRSRTGHGRFTLRPSPVFLHHAHAIPQCVRYSCESSLGE